MRELDEAARRRASSTPGGSTTARGNFPRHRAGRRQAAADLRPRARRRDAAGQGSRARARSSVLTVCAGALRSRAGRAEGERRAALAHWITDREEPAHLAQHRQPRLAVSLRPRIWSTRPTTSAAWASCRRIPNCSTGWRRSSATAAQSLKPLHRLIVTSATYRQASRGERRRREAIDADNPTLAA